MTASKEMPLSVSGGQFCLNYKRDVKFMNNVTVTLDEKITKIKVVDLDQFYKFYVDDFSAEIIYSFKMLFQVDIF